MQGSHLKHSPLLWDGSLAKLGLGCTLLEQLMNFGDASTFITSVSDSEQFKMISLLSSQFSL